MLCEQLNENLQGGVWGFLNTKALQLSRSLLYSSQDLLKKVTTSSYFGNIVSKIQ